MGRIVANILKGIAEGRYGERPQRLYWWLAGRKTKTALWIGIPSALVQIGIEKGICEAMQWACSDWLDLTTEFAVGASVVLGFIGQVDGAVRVSPPRNPNGLATH